MTRRRRGNEHTPGPSLTLEVSRAVFLIERSPEHSDLAPEVFDPLAVSVLGDYRTSMVPLRRDGRKGSRKLDFVVVVVIGADYEPKVGVVANNRALGWICKPISNEDKTTHEDCTPDCVLRLHVLGGASPKAFFVEIGGKSCDTHARGLLLVVREGSNHLGMGSDTL